MTQVLSLGFPLPNYRIDNYNVFSAPSYFDYESMIIDPASITTDVLAVINGTGTFEAFDGRPVVNGATTAEAVSASDMLRRRGEETRRLLDNGGLVIVITRPNAVVYGLIGFEGCDRMSWLPAPAGMSWGPPMLRAADGKTVRIVDDDHPLAGTMRNFRNDMAYRAVFDDRQQAFRDCAHVVAAGGANTPIAVEFQVLSGRVIFIPALTDSANYQRSEIAQSLTDAIRDLELAAVSGDVPYWTGSMPLPGIESIEETLAGARLSKEAAETDLKSAQASFEDIARYRRILWESGPNLRAAVIDGLRTLGFEVTEGAQGLRLEHEGTSVMIEVEGSREQVVEWPYVRLQRRLEERMLKHSEKHGGLIVVNGYRLIEPGNRQQEYTDALRVACENYRYGLMTGATLFALVSRALEGATEADLLGIRRRITAAIGLLDTPTAIGDRETKPAEPLF